MGILLDIFGFMFLGLYGWASYNHYRECRREGESVFMSLMLAISWPRELIR